MKKLSLAFVFLLTFQNLAAYDKSGAFIGVGAGYMPKMELNLADKAHAPLASLGLKYGARYYFNDFIGLSLYMPFEGGYSLGNDLYTFSAGMGGDLLLDFGTNRGLGLFVGSELLYSKYWLNSYDISGTQRRIHAGLALNFNPRLSMHISLRYTPYSPLREQRGFESIAGMKNYGVFVGLVFGLDNSNITKEQAVREERYRLEREEEIRRSKYSSKYAYHYDYSSQANSIERSFSSILGAFFGGILGSSNNTQKAKK